MERTNKTLEDMLKTFVGNKQGKWKQFLHLVKFVYNGSSHSSIDMIPFHAMYGYECLSPLLFFLSQRGEKDGCKNATLWNLLRKTCKVHRNMPNFMLMKIVLFKNLKWMTKFPWKLNLNVVVWTWEIIT
jgi:hypothetical protein